MLKRLVALARSKGASDLHLEPGQPITLRVRGQLTMLDERVEGSAIMDMARGVVPPGSWVDLVERRSFDLSRVIAGAHCRINVLQSARGVGMAVRLLSSFRPTIEGLNLHPELRTLSQAPHGLLLVTGPTGSGKSSTMAALIEAINEDRACHIITVEEPIEYHLEPRRSLIRQREVGRDTPSFAQALLDALREDPDVLMVGEMRRAETMQLTLDAAETGHLVLATMHSSSVSEAVQRLVASFPPGEQDAVRAQLSGCLVGVICQRLTFRADVGLRVPECQILTANAATKSIIRQGAMHKLDHVLSTGREDGMWSWDRYRRWLDSRTGWSRPPAEGAKTVQASPAATLGGSTARPSSPGPAAAGTPTYDLGEGESIDSLIAKIEER